MSDERTAPTEDAGTAVDDEHDVDGSPAEASTDGSAVGEGDDRAGEADATGDGGADGADALSGSDGPSIGEESAERLLETTISDLETVTAQRDEYLDMARRVQAEFENYRKRTESQRVELVARAAENLVRELLPVLDACEAAIAHDAVDVEPIHAALEGTLTKQGLEKVDKADVPFDPNVHEAVLSEPAEEGQGEPVVAEVMRAGYLWNGRVVRAAMVKVRG